MSKRKEAQTNRALTRRQIAISRREKEQLRLIYVSLGGVAALILIVLAIGLIQTYIIEPNAPIAVVEGERIRTGDYQARVKYERFLLDQQYLQILQQQAALAQSDNEQLNEFLSNQYQQQANQIIQQRTGVDRHTADAMIEDILVKAEAARRGITVSEDEITEFINRSLAGRLGGFTTEGASDLATARVEASATAALFTPTSTLTPSPTITFTEEITPATPPVDTPTPGPTPTLNIVDADTLNTEYADWLNSLEEGAGIGETEYRHIIRASVLRSKLQEVLGDEVPTSAEQAHARHILVETEEQAQEVIGRLEAGEDFAELAGELSIDPGSASRGGDLGFVARGTFVEPVDEAIFSLPIGQISLPIESDFGWHVIEVLEREVRELSPGDYLRSQRLAFSTWLSDARANAEIEDLWTPDSAPKDQFFAP